MATEILRPNSDYSLGWSEAYPTNTTHYDKVNSTTSPNFSKYIRNNNAGAQVDDYFGIPSHSVGSGTISNVRVVAEVSPSYFSGTPYFRVSLITNSTNYNGSQQNSMSHGQIYTIYSDWATNPNTSSSWTWSDIDALKIGVGCNGTPYSNYCDLLYVEVTYTPSTNTSSFLQFFN